MILPLSKLERVNHNGTTGTTKDEGAIKPSVSHDAPAMRACGLVQLSL